ncbi:hypothetical protein FY136_28810 (plasmid) [Agrobacterium tumefaciens]|uniref:hypothetical protein n=1 Tax=Agrobacterium tumefaciens TaxID=358 RepID=UPI0021D04497|nr:hypothetical protein [Agrobacterium tumefaciens]UXT53265.1 hypothetical protein FY136_28810 [Agrobacterium tumefaciens]
MDSRPAQTRVFIQWVAPGYAQGGSRFLFEIDADAPEGERHRLDRLIESLGEIKWGLVASFPRHSAEQVADDLTANGYDLIEDEERGELLRQRAFDANGTEFQRLTAELQRHDGKGV